ncbi:MAG: hypothetical protein DMG37_23180, partial [Acidobacteria bacterium]
TRMSPFFFAPRRLPAADLKPKRRRRVNLGPSLLFFSAFSEISALCVVFVFVCRLLAACPEQ